MKFVRVPKQVTGREIDQEGLAYKALANLIKARNDLVHPKSSPATVLDPVAFGQEKAANEAKYRKIHDDAHGALRAVILMSFEMARLVAPHYCQITDLSIEPNTFDLRHPQQVHALAIRIKAEYEQSVAGD